MKTEKKPKDLITNEKKCLKVIEKIESGMSERAACDAVGINRLTFRSAVLRSQIVDQYAQALASLAHAQAEKMEQAIEDMRNGLIDHQMARVEIDARKWFASKFLPKQYGDKTTQEITGPNGGPLQSTTLAITPHIEAEIMRIANRVDTIQAPAKLEASPTHTE